MRSKKTPAIKEVNDARRKWQEKVEQEEKELRSRGWGGALPAWLDIRQGEQYRLRTWWHSEEWDKWTRVRNDL